MSIRVQAGWAWARVIVNAYHGVSSLFVPKLYARKLFPKKLFI